MSESVRFDRAAEFYDRTRAISGEAMARTVELLGAELQERGRVLEVGVGTGLVALPLHASGIDLLGLDLSGPMVAKLIEKAGGRAPFPIALGDATRLPFGEGAFGAAYLRWVLHLIPDWRGVLAEIVRVVRPRGVFVAHLGAYAGPDEEIRKRFAEITGVSLEPVGLPWSGFDELDREMAGHGASVRLLPPVPERGEGTIGQLLDGIDRNVYSWTWNLPDDVRRNAAAEVRAWAHERFGPIDVVTGWEQPHVWHAYDLA
ncbi:MAG: class I SAM-dependent methyltransferase [Actinomycetota bacterium]